MTIKKIISALGVGLAAAVAAPLMVTAAAAVIVTPTNEQGWTSTLPGADTRVGGSVSFVEDADAPAGAGALRLETDATTTAKAQYMHGADNLALSEVDELSYYTKQVSSSFPGGAPSYQLPVFLNGGTSGFTTFVFEPYQNGTVIPNIWQSWDVDAGKFWSSRSVTCSSNGGVTAGGGGAPFYSLAQLNAMCPDAVVAGFGVNIGSNNPSYDTLTDLVSFNGQAYDFEPALSPSSKNACKDNGWQTFNAPVFKNQGQCVSFVASDGKSNQ